MSTAEIVSYDTQATERPLTFTLEEAFDFFNQRLWSGELPPIVLLVHRSTKITTGGHYSPRRWRARDESTVRASEEEMAKRDADLWQQNAKESDSLLGDPNGWERGEIALNPERWPFESDREILAVLVHEMAHHWQSCFGKEPRGGYHNKQWGREMKRVGLYPSNTGKPDGKETGQQMTHYVIEGGLFEKACEELLAGGMRLSWESPKPKRLPRPKSKLKYTCGCGKNAWAKPDSKLICGECSGEMIAEGDE